MPTTDDDMDRTPLDRINYVDGQRLTAELLQKEQDFHRRLRQWLSKSLFTPGVADGLVPDVKDGMVTLTDGLAIDEWGRAIVLLEPSEPLEIEARFLTIRYSEQTYRQASDGCLVGPIEPGGAAVPTAWDGPTVIRKVPVIGFANRVPDNDKMELVLAEFEIDGDCKAVGVKAGPNRFATPKQLAGIHTFALEGEKDIDADNPKLLRFHVHGRRPTSVTLYLQSDKFSSLYYSELGEHGHAAGSAAGTGGTGGAVWDVPAEATRFPTHNHTIEHRHDEPTASAVTTSDSLPLDQWRMHVTGRLNPAGAPHSLKGRGHQHVEFSIDTPRVTRDSDGKRTKSGANSAAYPVLGHEHSVTVDVQFNKAGSAPNAEAREMKPISFIKKLRIEIDEVDVTKKVIDQVDLNSLDTWNELGDGSGGVDDLLMTKGTGPIRINMLDGVDILPGTHTIKLFLHEDDRILIDAYDKERPNGGKIYYNLYVEAE